MDNELTGYEQIIKSIEEAPMTYLPSILSEVIKQCVKKKVFIDSEKLVVFVQQVIKKLC